MKRMIFIVMLGFALPALADSPIITAASASQSADGWRFDVTLSHPDSGWDHYADGWRLLDMEGNEIGRRVLAHPHVNEQPFTRSLGGVPVPAGTTQVQIEARCFIDGWTGAPMTITLP
ncbi:MAG: hypothetical protein JKY94_12955 [Rhodobacteraceae bacterium]|nr:hypothetical protein [Paracoccaceae bacterium]